MGFGQKNPSGSGAQSAAGDPIRTITGLPPILCFFGARWLMDRFGLGSWVLLIAVLLALASIVSAFTQFFRYMLRQAEEEERDYKEGGL